MSFSFWSETNALRAGVQQASKEVGEAKQALKGIRLQLKNMSTAYVLVQRKLRYPYQHNYYLIHRESQYNQLMKSNIFDGNDVWLTFGNNYLLAMHAGKRSRSQLFGKAAAEKKCAIASKYSIRPYAWNLPSWEGSEPSAVHTRKPKWFSINA